MRTPRRDFVVEYKTNRRQTKTQPASIWGNVDLKAVARDVELETILPKADSRPSEFLRQPLGAEAEEPARDVQPVDGHLDPIATSSPEDSGNEAPAVVVPEVSPIDSAPDREHPASTPVPTSKSPARRRASTRAPKEESPTSHVGLKDRLDSPEGFGSEEELLALEAENLRLKRLVAKSSRRKTTCSVRCCFDLTSDSV